MCVCALPSSTKVASVGRGITQPHVSLSLSLSLSHSLTLTLSHSLSLSLSVGGQQGAEALATLKPTLDCDEDARLSTVSGRPAPVCVCVCVCV
jgi:hypothetical protein